MRSPAGVVRKETQHCSLEFAIPRSRGRKANINPTEFPIVQINSFRKFFIKNSLGMMKGSFGLSESQTYKYQDSLKIYSSKSIFTVASSDVPHIFRDH